MSSVVVPSIGGVTVGLLAGDGDASALMAATAREACPRYDSNSLFDSLISSFGSLSFRTLFASERAVRAVVRLDKIVSLQPLHLMSSSFIRLSRSLVTSFTLGFGLCESPLLKF